MKKAESRKIVDAIALSQAIEIESADSIYLDKVLTDKSVSEIFDVAIFDVVTTDINSLFDSSEKQAVNATATSDSYIEQSVFASNKLRNNEITSTFLIDTVLAMSIKMSLLAERKLTVGFVASHCADLNVTDKFEQDDSKLISKLTRRISSHINANATRKKSLLYKQVKITNNEIIVSDRVKSLVCDVMI